MRIKFIWFLSLFSGFIFAQVDPSFINHLVNKKLKQEHFSYLNQLEKLYPDNDSLKLEWLKWGLYQEDFKYFESKFYQSPNDLAKNDSCLIFTASVLAVKQKPSSYIKWFAQKDIQFSSKKTKVLFDIFQLTENPSQFNAEEITFLPANLSYYFTEYQRFHKKKPIIAGALSLIIPGAGKLYNGRRKGFLPSLIMNTILGAFTYEAISKTGISNPYSIFSLGAFSIFYLSNIYGSYQELKLVKQEKKEDFLHNVSNHYNFPCLYK